MLLSDAIDRYVADRKVKGYAPETIRSHRTYLKMFLGDIGNIHITNVTVKHLDTFWAIHQDWSPGNFNKVRAVLSTFFGWCRDRAYLSAGSDPLSGLRKRKVVPRERIILEPNEFDDVLDAASNPRDRALIAIGLYLFTRVSETTNIRWGDINWDAGIVQVYRKKTTKLEDLPLVTELELELKRWRLTYSELMGQFPKPGWFVAPSYSKPVFLGSRGGVNNRSAVFQETPMLMPTHQLGDATQRVKKALARAGYMELVGEGGHTLRRSGATALYNELSDRGHDRAIRMCQAMLGHSSIRDTEIYLRLDLDRKARNDLLAGKRMFTNKGLARVIAMSDERVGSSGEANA